jgi:hypothetical protein
MASTSVCIRRDKGLLAQAARKVGAYGIAILSYTPHVTFGSYVEVATPPVVRSAVSIYMYVLNQPECLLAQAICGLFPTSWCHYPYFILVRVPAGCASHNTVTG